MNVCWVSGNSADPAASDFWVYTVAQACVSEYVE